MRRSITFLLFLLIFTAACATSPAAPTTDLGSAGADAASTASPTDEGEILQTVNQALPTATSTPTAALQPTATPSPTPTPTLAPAVFDQVGFRQFAVLRSDFPGYLDYLAEKNSTQISYALSPSGDQIAISACWGYISNTGSCESTDSGFLVVLDTNSGKLVTEIPVGEGWPGGVAFTPDGQSLLYGTTELKVALWDIAGGKPGLTLFNQPLAGSRSYPAVAASPDGRSYASVVGKRLYVWDLSGEILFQTPAERLYSSYGAFAYDAGGSRLTVLSADRAGVEVYDTSNWTLIRRFELADISDASISPDGRVLAAIESAKNTAVVWDVQTGERLAELDPGHWASFIRFNPAGDLLIIAGMGNLDFRDGYSSIGTVYETQSWSRLDSLYSFAGDGQVEFNRDGSRMAVFNGGFLAIWEMPDAQLLAGFETVKKFQTALHTGDFAAAAALFTVDERDAEYLTQTGVDPSDLAGSFERLCANQTIFCYPVQELVMMGYNWDDLTYLVRLSDPEGGTFRTPKGAQIIYFYLAPGADGQPRLTYPPLE